MSLLEPTKKMSKSDPSPGSRILLTDSEKEIFAKIKGAKKAADDHKAKAEAQESKPAAASAPYRHVPTHAATDAPHRTQSRSAK